MISVPAVRLSIRFTIRSYSRGVYNRRVFWNRRGRGNSCPFEECSLTSSLLFRKVQREMDLGDLEERLENLDLGKGQ